MSANQRFCVALLLIIVLAAVSVAGWFGHPATSSEVTRCWPVGSGQVIPDDIGIACVAGSKGTLYYPLAEVTP